MQRYNYFKSIEFDGFKNLALEFEITGNVHIFTARLRSWRSVPDSHRVAAKLDNRYATPRAFFNYGEFAIITFKFLFRDENKFVIQTKYRKLQPKTNKNIIELCQSHLSKNC